jgi:hypothetical protein
MNSASAVANAINQLAESHPGIIPKISEASMSKIHIAELGGCGMAIIVEGSRAKGTIDEVMDDPTTKKALDALGNILVETGTVAACAGVAAESPIVYRYVSGSTLLARVKEQSSSLGLLGAILTLFGGSISLRSSYMPDNKPAIPIDPAVDANPVVPAAVDSAAVDPSETQTEKPWWKVILHNIPSRVLP